jgi:VIT1/CCC1 family predicted Fe2+/Mn2+ transporter
MLLFVVLRNIKERIVDYQHYTQNQNSTDFNNMQGAPGMLPRPQPLAPIEHPTQTADTSKHTLFGILSVAVSLLASVLFIMLIFHISLLSTSSKIYTWIGIFLILGMTGLLLAALSMKRRSTVNIFGLIGLILSLVICFQCLVVGLVYIKIKTEIHSLTTSSLF